MICKQCSKEFIGKDKNHIYTYCSKKCHDLSQIGKPTKRFDKIKRKGYWFIHMPEHPNAGKQGYFAEHRLVMEKKIGRFLGSKEIVHHINHDKTDNTPDNLMLFSNWGDHLKYGHPELPERYKIEFKGCHFSPNTEFKPKE